MVEGFSRDRLMPALLDRLLDERPQERQESESARTMTRSELRQSVLRDLTWLFNAQSASAGDIDPDRHPHALRSGLNYGLPPLAGQLLSNFALRDLEQMLRQVIVDFEPRILADTVVVRGVAPEDSMGHHNAISFEITAQLWAQPYPLELLLKSDLDLETGLVELHEASGPSVRAARTGAAER
jgi:type VI secretion system protein ImpF